MDLRRILASWAKVRDKNKDHVDRSTEVNGCYSRRQSAKTSCMTIHDECSADVVACHLMWNMDCRMKITNWTERVVYAAVVPLHKSSVASTIIVQSECIS